MAISQNLNGSGNLWEIPPIGEGFIPDRSNTITCMRVVHRFRGSLVHVSDEKNDIISMSDAEPGMNLKQKIR